MQLRSQYAACDVSEHAAACKSLANVLKFSLVGDHVEDDRADALFRKTTQLGSDVGITTDEVGTIRSISQKREKPITILVKFPGLTGFVQPPFPNRVGILHRIF